MGRTLIIGAGVIGLACGWELCKRGEEVIVLDRGEPGAACSAGNAGWIVPSISTPLPAPGLMATSIRWMLKRDSPLYIQPRLDPRFAGWLTRFWRNCTPETYAEGLRALARLNDTTMPLFDQWQSDGVAFEMHRSGLLFLGLSQHAVEETAAEVVEQDRAGYERPVILDSETLRDVQPGLADAVAAGFLVKPERHVRPESLTAGLVRRLTDAGGDVRSGVEVTDGIRSGSRIKAVKTSNGTISADRVILANGAWAGQLAARLGFHLPIEAGKGYSITIDAPRRIVRYALDLIEARVAVSPFQNGLRLAGTMELSGLNERLQPRRVEAIRRAGERYLGEWRGGTREHVWVGMRPLTPDGLPAIGRAPASDNLFVAAGHQMLGVTLAPATGNALARLILDESSGKTLQPFDPARFQSTRRRP